MSANTPTGNAAERPRLSEEQKKQNHIVSEQKRRQAIRAGFDRLASIVPGMEGQGRSEAVVLQATVTEIEKELREQEILRRKGLSSGMMTEKDFDKAYKERPEAQKTGRGAANAASPGSATASNGRGQGR